jgi:hypothetical protein
MLRFDGEMLRSETMTPSGSPSPNPDHVEPPLLET